MIKIETFQEAIEPGSVLDQMFRGRAAVFRDRLGWNVEVHDGLEIDRCDRADPIYVLACRGEKVAGSLRVLPTTGETMLKNEFAGMFGEPVDFASPTAWECTRFCVHDAEDTRTSLELNIGICELALKSGIEQIVALYDARMTRVYKRFGWTPAPLARTERPGEILIVGIWEVSEAALARLRAKEAEMRGGRAA